jgi:hypothetical protein
MIGSCVEVAEPDQLDFACRCRCRGTKLRGGFGAAKEKQVGGFRARLPGSEQQVLDAAQAGEMSRADRLSPLGLADGKQHAPAVGVVAEGGDVDLVRLPLLRVVDQAAADLGDRDAVDLGGCVSPHPVAADLLESRADDAGGEPVGAVAPDLLGLAAPL